MVMVAAPRRSPPATSAERERRKFTRAEYDRLIELGFFQGEKLELLRGELVVMSPVGTRHRWTVTTLQYALHDPLRGRALVLTQQPLVGADESQPEPDLSVVTDNDPRAHPRHALLVIEVAESSLITDLTHKAALYAESEVDEYWVVDLQRDVVHVHRRRMDGAWGAVTMHRPGDTIAPLAFPDVAIEVASIIAAR